MLTAMIAEGDVLVRTGIRASVPWADMDIVLTGEAGDGTETLELFRRYRPDLLILGLPLPGTDGAALLQRIRGENPRCNLIILAATEADAVSQEEGDTEACRVMLRRELKKNDLRVAVEQVCATQQTGRDSFAPLRSETVRITAWHDFLFGKGCERLPYRAMGMTAFRLFPKDGMNPTLQQSLVSQMLQKFGSPRNYTLLTREDCRILIWPELPEKHVSETALMELIRYAWDTFEVHIGCVTVPDAPNGIRMPDIARDIISMLQDSSLFDEGMIVLDAEGQYRQVQLDAVRHEFAICLPFCMENADIMAISEALGQYPEALEKGFDQVRENAGELLGMLGIDGTETGGLVELTGKICDRAGERLKQAVPEFRPQIRKAMDIIQTRLSEDLPREEISRSVNYDSSYFSRLFRRETGMSYIDYRFYTRMLQAQEMMRRTNCSSSEIARAIGFSNTAYFFTRFRRFCGMTPGEWREQVIKEK